MNLYELITELKKRDPALVIRDGFGSGGSDRNCVCNAAFEPEWETLQALAKQTLYKE